MASSNSLLVSASPLPSPHPSQTRPELPSPPATDARQGALLDGNEVRARLANVMRRALVDRREVVELLGRRFRFQRRGDTFEDAGVEHQVLQTGLFGAYRESVGGKPTNERWLHLGSTEYLEHHIRQHTWGLSASEVQRELEQILATSTLRAYGVARARLNPGPTSVLPTRTDTATPRQASELKASMLRLHRHPEVLPESFYCANVAPEVGMLVEPVNNDPFIFELPDRIHLFVSHPGSGTDKLRQRARAGVYFQGLLAAHADAAQRATSATPATEAITAKVAPEQSAIPRSARP